MKRARSFTLIFVILFSASCGPKEPELKEAGIRKAIASAMSGDEMLKLVATHYGSEIDSIGPVFADGNNARTTFKLKNSAGNLHEGQARFSRAQDNKWYLVFVDFPDVAQAHAKCNVMVE